MGWDRTADDTHQIHAYPGHHDSARAKGQHNNEPNKDTAVRRIDPRTAKKNWETHRPIAPGNTSITTVAGIPNVGQCGGGMSRPNRTSAKNATEKERIEKRRRTGTYAHAYGKATVERFQHPKSSSGGWGSADCLRYGLIKALFMRRLAAMNHMTRRSTHKP